MEHEGEYLQGRQCRGYLELNLRFSDSLQEEPDSMKPLLDRMIDMIVAGLSGKAKAFYDQEFTFFEAVTSISGKLKPYIKRPKPEKKVSWPSIL